MPVVSVGNLTLGGTGKTPLVAWIAQWFHNRNVPVAVISRGYNAPAGGQNDEARELAAKLPGVPHLQQADRVAAAARALREFPCQAIILDDAFQHRRIGRDLDIVLLDALEPFGFGHVFPRGTLREPLAGLRRADLIALSRADMLDANQREELRLQAARMAPQAAWIEVRTRRGPCSRPPAHGGRSASLQAGPVAAFCGVGNPAGFRHTLATCGYELAGFREFPDHHAYTAHDLETLAAWASRLQATTLLCTHKDLVKLNVARLGDAELWAVCIELEILAGQAFLEQRLAQLAGLAPLGPPYNR